MLFYPEEKITANWEFLILASTILVTLTAPLAVIIDVQSSSFFVGFDIIITLIFVVDIYVNFNLVYQEKRHLITDRKLIRNRYLKGWFGIDLIATIPFALIFAGNPVFQVSRLFRFIKLMRLFKLVTGTKVIKRLQRETNLNPSIIRMITLIFWIALASHLIACGWILITGSYSPDVSFGNTYLIAFYWTMTTLTTIGYGDISPDPSSNAQLVYVIIIELMGAGMYGFIIGNIANLISNIDVAKSAYKEKMEKINIFMKYKNLPGDMQKKVNEYYDYLWESRRGYDETAILRDLPISLKTSVALFINKEIIEKVPIFKGASDEFIKDIILSLEPIVFSPGDNIVRKGEIGSEMFFISKGAVDVVSEDGQVVYATLTGGQFFGEIALLLSMPRTATVKAQDYCDLYVLNKDKFDEVLARFPTFKEEIAKLAEERRRETEKAQEENKKKEEEKVKKEKEKLPPPPSDFSIVDLDGGIIKITWDESEFADHYQIIKLELETGKWKELSLKIIEPEFRDINPYEGDNSYKIRSVNKLGVAGKWSEVLHIEK